MPTSVSGDTFRAVTTISIKELHDRTGQWLRRVEEAEEIVVTERGKPIARLVPATRGPVGNPFLTRRLLPGAASLLDRPIGGPDSAAIISAIRDGR